MQHSVLALDIGGTPHRWISEEKALYYYSKGLVAWEAGQSHTLYRGGTSAKTGGRSELVVNSIIAVKGKDFISKHYDRVPAFAKEKLLLRDRNVCAYCGDVFHDRLLDAEHIFPKSRGGPMTWMNLVTACKACNGRKANRTPEEANMPLLYVPYIPNRHEDFILRNRKILADQMEFLMLGVPKHSRLIG
jgi:hypothetical protein